MIKSIRIMALAVIMASTAMSSAMAQEQVAKESSAYQTSQNHAIYGKVGFPGIGIGYAYGVNENFGVRADVSTIGNYSRNDSSGNFNYDGDLKYNQAGVYGDWFPSAGNFRLTAGLQFRSAKVRANGRANDAGLIGIGDVEVLADPNDRAYGEVKFPSVAPYIGIGWGLNTAVNSPGWSVFADLGVTVGKPKVSLNVSDSLGAKLDLATGGNGQQEINKQVAELRSDTNKLKVVPQLFVGVAYKF